MKILIATSSFPPQVGGVAEVARTQATGFVARGHQVTVATGHDPTRTDAQSPPGVTVRQFQVTGSLASGGCRGAVAAYQEFLVREPADVILFHCWQDWAADAAQPVLARRPGPKVLLSHGFDAQVWKRVPRFPWGLGVWWRSQPYVRRLPQMMRAFDRLIFLSGQADAGRFYDVGVARRVCPERLAVIPNGVHLAEFKRDHGDFRKTHGLGPEPLLLNVANYCERKNQLATLRDFMAANREDARLVFIGGEFNDYQRELMREHGKLQRQFPKARVRCLEKIPKPQIYAAYQAADAFMLGAKYETQPLAILDAMAAGVPFISTDTGCVREFPGGLVVPSGDATTHAIHRLLDEPALRQQLGAQGRAACETKYDWERVLDAYERLFGELPPAR